MIPIAHTKIVAPTPRSDTLTRPRLINILHELVDDRRLVAVLAPAGYGKTTLLADFAQQTDLPVCWYALDRVDATPQRFIFHVIKSLQQQFPSFGKTSLSVLDESFNLDRITTVLANDIYEHIDEHYLLVIDDYHLVDHCTEINLFINQFVQLMDENGHVVIASRALPSLPDMSLMVARAQVAGIDFERLAFRSAEIQALMQQNYDLVMSEDEAHAIIQKTEGWITGLLLSAQVAQLKPDELYRVPGIDLYNYLAQQVLAQQPQTIRDFLLYTSILEEFDIKLCYDVLNAIIQLDWADAIQEASRNNLFLLPIDGFWFRYHPLFRDFLQEEFERAYPDQARHIKLRLADVYLERREWEKARDLYKQLNDNDAIVELIEQASANLVQGQISTISDWIDDLPLIRLPAKLLSLRGIIAAMMGDTQHGMSLLDKAIDQLADQPMYLARALMRRATIYRFRGQYNQSIADIDQAIQLIEDHQLENEIGKTMAEAFKVKAISLYRLGNLAEAINNLEIAQNVYQTLRQESGIALIYIDMGMIYVSMGQYKQAAETYDNALTYWRREGNNFRLATVLNNIGVLKHILGDYIGAWNAFEDALKCAKKQGYQRKESLILASIGDLYAQLSITEAAQSAYRQAREIAWRLNERHLLLYSTLAEVNLACENREIAMAHYLLNSAEQFVQEQADKGLYELSAGTLALCERNYTQAMTHLRTAVSLLQDNVLKARANFGLAHALFRLGEDEWQHYLQKTFDLTDLEQQLVTDSRSATPLLKKALKIPHLKYQAKHLLAEISKFEDELPNMRRYLRRRSIQSISFDPPEIIIYSLGANHVELNGVLADWQTKIVRDLFFLLLTHKEGLTKEKIGLTLWPDSTMEQLKVRFKNTIYRLRRALGKNIVILNEGTDQYMFNWQLDYKYDADAFVALIKQAQETPIEKQMAVYQSAVSLYRGDFLPEIDYTWVIAKQQRLHNTYINAILRMAQLYMERNDYQNALDSCQVVIQSEPCQEQAHRLAMRVYAAIGNRVGVAQQYQACKDALMVEINAAPSKKTIELYQQLMQ